MYTALPWWLSLCGTMPVATRYAEVCHRVAARVENDMEPSRKGENGKNSSGWVVASPAVMRAVRDSEDKLLATW